MTVSATQNKFSFSYSGTIDSSLISLILSQVEGYASSFHLIPDTKRKLLEIAIELLQNTYHHSPIKDSPLNHFEVKKDDDGFEISSSNLISESEMESLKSQLDYSNSLTSWELQKYYLNKLKNGFIAGENAGIGLIDIHRKSGKHILYKFVPQDNNYYLFTVIVLV